MTDKKLPRWSAPPIGAFVGVVGAVAIAPKIGSPVDGSLISCGALIGGLAGILIFLFGSSESNVEKGVATTSDEAPTGSPASIPTDHQCAQTPPRESKWQRYSIALSLGTLVLPIVGVVFAAAAVVLNWRSSRLQNLGSWIVALLSVLWTVVALRWMELL